jgi:mannosyltransferase OCH1-like enzyme
MIPKIIHYCWLSGEQYPELIEKCVNSWKNILPGYEIILWDTMRINVNSNLWLKQTYENRKYAFASDYVRFYALYNHGGIYLDADVEVVKSFDCLLHKQYFIGEEITGDVEAAAMGAQKGLDWVRECLDYYERRSFIKEDGQFDTTPVTLLIPKITKKYNMEILPYDYFSANNYQTGKIIVSNNTYCIHHLVGKWFRKGPKYKIKMLIHRFFYFLFGRAGHNRLIRIIRTLSNR